MSVPVMVPPTMFLINRVSSRWPPHTGERKVLVGVPGALFGCEVWSDHPAVVFGIPHHVATRGPQMHLADGTVSLYLRTRGAFVATVDALCWQQPEGSQWSGWKFVRLDEPLLESIASSIRETLERDGPNGPGIVNPDAFYLTLIGGLRPDTPPDAQL